MRLESRSAGRAIRPLLVLLAMLTARGHVVAQGTECYTDSVPLLQTNWDRSVTFPRFDDTSRVLTLIEFTLDASVEGSMGVENADAMPVTLSMAYSAIIQLQRPDTSPLVAVIPTYNVNIPLGGFDGTIDFAGTSGTTLLGLVVNDCQTIECPPTPLDFSEFTGVGTVTLPVLARGNSTGTGPG